MLRLLAIIALYVAVACAKTPDATEHIDVAEAESQQIPWAEIPPAQQVAIERAATWLRANHVSTKWSYQLGSIPACRPYLMPLEGEYTMTGPVDHEGEHLVTDLETDRFWLLVTMDYFGPAHYFGPARLNTDGELEPLTGGEGNHTCVH